MITFDISDYTFEGQESYEVQDIYNWGFVENCVVPSFEKLGYKQEEIEEAVEAVFNNGDYEVVKKNYEIKRFYNQTISRRDFRVSGRIEWHFKMLDEEVVLFSDFWQEELYDNQEAHELFDELLEKLRENGWQPFYEQFNEWAKDKKLVDNFGNEITEKDIEIEYNHLSDDDLYQAYDQDVVSDEFEFNFNFDNLPLEYIEEDD